MTVDVFGYRFGILKVIAALLQIVTVLCATESIWGPNSQIRQVTKYVLFGIIGAVVAVLLEQFFVVTTEYPIVISLVAGAGSGMSGGFLGQWFQDLSEASRSYEPTMDSLTGLVVAREGVRREVRASLHTKQTLTRRRQELHANIKLLEAVANVKTGRAKRERELAKLMIGLKEIDRFAERNRRKLKLHQEQLEKIEREIDDKATQAANYATMQARLESILKVRRLAIDYLVFASVTLGISVALALAAQISIAVILPFTFAAFMALRQISIIVKVASSIASTLNLDGPRFFGFSWKHFLIGFLPMLIMQLFIWLLPDLHWANAALALVLAVGGGLASSFAQPADRLVKDLTMDQLKLVGLGCVIAGIVLPMFNGS
jgi:uncharacterized protein YjeT (DUF2065 family)